MRKLKDDKKIKWTENYTERTVFLKEMYNDIVGPNSYWRFEGKEVGGSDEWYVVVSPAGVVGEHEKKFFAGVRKLPDKWPAGGKKFDSLIDAFTYAADTWGVPKPNNLPRYSGQDLVGIGQRIDEWKSTHEEDEKIKKEDGKKKSATKADVVKEAMGRGIHNKGGCAWHNSDFTALDAMLRSDSGICTKIDATYANLLRQGAAAASRVLAGVEIGATESDGYDFPHLSTSSRQLAVRAEQSIAAICSYAETIAANEHLVEMGSNTAKNPREFIECKRLKRSQDWHPRSRFLKGLQMILSVGSDYATFESERFYSDRDYRIMVAALVAYSERRELGSQISRLSEFSGPISDEFGCCFRRSGLELALHENSINIAKERQSYRGRYGISDETPDSSLPVNNFIEYSKTDSNVRLISVSPYRSSRKFDDKCGFAEDIFTNAMFVAGLRVLATSIMDSPTFGGDSTIEEVTATIREPLMDSCRRQFADIDINQEASKSVKKEFGDAFAAAINGLTQFSGMIAGNAGRIAVTYFVAACSGELVSVASNPDGSMGYARIRTGNEKARFFQSIGKFYSGVKAVSSSQLGAASFFSTLSNADDVAILNSNKEARAYRDLRSIMLRRMEGAPAAMRRSYETALRSIVVSRIQANGEVRDVSVSEDEYLPITPADLFNAFKNYGITIYPGEIFDIFDDDGSGTMQMINEESVEVMTKSAQLKILSYLNKTKSGSITIAEACMLLKGMPTSSENIAKALDDQGVSGQSLYESVGISFSFSTKDNYSGIPTVKLDLDAFGQWQMLKIHIGSLWKMKEISPDVYARFMKLNMIPVRFTGGGREQVEHLIDNHNFAEAEAHIENHFIRARELAERHDHQEYDSIADCTYDRYVAESRVTPDPSLRSDPLNSIGINQTSLRNKLGSMRTALKSELGYAIIAGTANVPGEQRAELLKGVTLSVPSAIDDDVISDSIAANGITKEPGDTFSGEELVDQAGNILPLNVPAFGGVLPISHVTVFQEGSRRDKERAMASSTEKALGKGAFPALNIDHSKGTMSADSIREYGNNFNDGSPVVEELVRSDKNYGEVMKELAIGLRGVFSIPHGIDGNGDVNFSFDISQSSGITSRYLAQRYCDRLSQYLGNDNEEADFSRVSQLGPRLTNLVVNMHNFFDRAGICLNDIVDEVQRRVTAGESPIWWRESGNVEYMSDNTRISLPSFTVWSEAVAYATSQAERRNIPRSDINSTAKRVQDTAIKVVKRDAFLAITTSPQLRERVLSILDDEERTLVTQVATDMESVPEGLSQVVAVADDAELSPEDRAAIDRAFNRAQDAMESDVELALETDIAAPIVPAEEIPNEAADANIVTPVDGEDVDEHEQAVEEEDGLSWLEEAEAEVEDDGLAWLEEAESEVEENELGWLDEAEAEAGENDEESPESDDFGLGDDFEEDIDFTSLSVGTEENDEERVLPEKNIPQVTRAATVRGIIKASLKNMAASSIRLAKEGKTTQADEINRIIKRYIERD